jgi:hypothetical protein
VAIRGAIANVRGTPRDGDEVDVVGSDGTWLARGYLEWRIPDPYPAVDL